MFDVHAYGDFLDEANKAFTPFTPTGVVELFKGRTSHVSRIVRELRSPGRHVILYGDRGVGKTSLATLIWFFSQWPQKELLHSCSTTSTFDTIFSSILEDIGITHVPSSSTNTSSAGISMAGLHGSYSSSTEQQRINDDFRLTPQFVCKAFENKHHIVILDEYDRVEHPATDTAVADLIKQLSDSDSGTKVVIVGVADSIVDLVGQHPSVVRNLAEIKLPRMSKAELLEILEDGFVTCNLSCELHIKEKVAGLSDGFPHFTHLMGLKIAEAVAERALLTQEMDGAVTESDYTNALEKAIDGSHESLQKAYTSSVETTRRRSDRYKRVLEGIAIDDSTEVQVQRILENMNRLYDTQLKVQNINSNLGRLIGDGERGVLSRPRTGIYKFKDPMLRAFVRMQIARTNRSDSPSQLHLPYRDWMN